MPRETERQLQVRMLAAEHMVPKGYRIRHVRSGAEYMVHSHALRIGDLETLVNYASIAGPMIMFSRKLSEVQAKFVRVDGEDWQGLENFQPF